MSAVAEEVKAEDGKAEPEKKHFYCEVCKISCMCAISLQSHYRGAKHRKVNFFHIKCICRFNRKSGTLEGSALDFMRLQVLI